MATLTDYSHSASINRISRLWLTHRAEEMALHLVPEAAKICAELFQRMPDNELLIQVDRSPGIKDEDEAYSSQKLLAETAFHLSFTGGSHTVKLNMLQTFQRLRLKPAFYDYLAIRVISEFPQHSSQNDLVRQFHSARSQFSLEMDECLQEMDASIEQVFQQCNATQYISLSAAKDIARIVLRQYVHCTRDVPDPFSFKTVFLRRYKERLSGMDASEMK